MTIKGYSGKDASYAEGGAVLGRTRDFMKTPDRFRGDSGKYENCPTDDNFGKKGGKDMAPAARKDKCLPAVKPHS